MDINLVTDSWIPFRRDASLSLMEFFQSPLEPWRLPPITEAALLRLLLWVKHVSGGQPRQWLIENEDMFSLRGEGRFLQDVVASRATGSRAPNLILNQDDENSPALSLRSQFDNVSEVALALLTAYMADRAGLKSGTSWVDGKIPRSGVESALSGKYVVFEGCSFVEALQLNQRYISDTVADLIMWPWRRLWLQDDMTISICTGETAPEFQSQDPFIGRKARHRKPKQQIKESFEALVWEQACPGTTCLVYALATKQAAAPASYKQTYVKPVASNSEEE